MLQGGRQFIDEGKYKETKAVGINEKVGEIKG